MPWARLPEIFVDELQAVEARGGRCLELGCGDGALRAAVARLGVALPGLDRFRGPDGAVSLVGDARRPPLLAGSLDLLVAANLARHLVPRDRRWGFVGGWTDLLAPGGALYVFEDEPRRSPAACRNFRDVQAFLAELMPLERGPLLETASMERAARRAGTWRITHTGRVDEFEKLDAGAVTAMLRGDGGAPALHVARLLKALESGGLAAGGYWWCRITARENGS